MTKGIDMADVKPTLVSWFVVGLMAITFIAAAKWATTRWRVRGLSELVASV